MLAEFPALARSVDNAEEVAATSCNKDTGSERKLQKWRRGVWFCVGDGGGGHISMWQPLYK